MCREQLKAILQEEIEEVKNPAGESYHSLSLLAAGRIAVDKGCSLRDVELAALDAGAIPERYQRSVGTVGMAGQKKLLQATVGVIGAGGLGGFVLELLARMGLGRLVVVDGDAFSDSNLNRQLLATEKNLGLSKVDAAASRATLVNSAVEIEKHHCRGDRGNLPRIFSQCDLVIDCLDNLPSRFALEDVCRGLGMMMIHGAIAGFLGQLAVIRPDKPRLAMIYGQEDHEHTGGGAEITLGNPAFTPAMLASWQAGEAIKIIADLEGVLPDNILLIIDMQTGESYKIELASS